MVRFDIKASTVWQPDVIGDDAPQAKPLPAKSVALLMDCEDESAPLEDIYVYMVEEDYPAEKSAQVVTKAGEPQALYGICARYSEADDMSGASMFMNNLPFYSDGTYKDQDSYFWPGKGYLKFYAYAPYNEADSYIEFDNDGNPFIACTVSGDKDMMAGSSEIIANYSTSAVEIQLTHLLSKIQVKTGSIPEGEIAAFAVKNVYSSGTCSLEDNGYSWSIDDDTDDYVQSASASGAVLPADSQTKVVGDPMFLLPQDLPSEAVLEVQIKVIDGDCVRSYVLTKKLSDLGITRLNPDKMYSFIISTPEEVKIEISDEVEMEGEYVVKKNLVIKNVGMSSAWFRATISGAWMLDYNGKTFVIANWQESDGEFEGLCPDSHWAKGRDKFYYYKTEVQRGEELVPLFEKYKLTAHAPIANAYLELTVYVQALTQPELFWPEMVAVTSNL